MLLSSMKESLSKANQQVKMKDIHIESLKLQLEQARHHELKLASQNSTFHKLKEELSNSTITEALIGDLLHQNKVRIHELKMELHKRKKSNSKLLHIFVGQTKQLGHAKNLLQKSKLEISHLHHKIEKSHYLSTHKSLKTELELAKENLNRAEKGEKIASLNIKSLLEEVNLLKSELNLAEKSEENSKIALDKLASVLQKAMSEASQINEKLMLTKIELHQTKKEAEESKTMVNYIEKNYKLILDKAKKSCNELKNNTQKLKLEAEESLLGWNMKEIRYVNCMKKAEEEKIGAMEEKKKLMEMLTNSEKLHRLQREENAKLVDMIKEALDEANGAKEDWLIENDDGMDFLVREYENLCINEFQGLPEKHECFGCF